MRHEVNMLPLLLGNLHSIHLGLASLSTGTKRALNNCGTKTLVSLDTTYSFFFFIRRESYSYLSSREYELLITANKPLIGQFVSHHTTIIDFLKENKLNYCECEWKEMTLNFSQSSNIYHKG